MIKTTIKFPLTEELITNYFKHLVNSFFKILPIREGGEETLPTYIESLQIELIGCKELISEFDNDPGFLTLVSILQYLKDHPDCPVKEVKREVFRAIAICNKLKALYEKAE